MNLSFFIARKYFFSKKISGVIHVISLISVIGIMVGTFALVTILSSFNGFEEVVSQLYNTFDSDLKLSPQKGKYFELNATQIEKIKKLPAVQAFTPVIEENVLLRYQDKETIATIKAVSPKYLYTTGIDSMIIVGNINLQAGGANYALVGAGVAGKLNLQTDDEFNPLQIYVPKKDVKIALNPEKAFNQKNIMSGGVFSIQQDFDNRYLIIPIDFARELLHEPSKVTAYEVNIKKNYSIEKAQEAIQKISGSFVSVNDRYQQQPMLYKVMRSEKLVVYLILSFILLIAAFNLVGALLMLAIEKQKDMAVLLSLGATPKLVQDVILMEGLILSFSGAISGIFFGWLICFLQMKFGFVKIAEGTTFVIDAYPVAFQFTDFVLVFATVIILGFAASYYPAITAYKRLDTEALRSSH